MSDTESVLNEVYDELSKARSKFAPFNSAHEGYAVILEELDELWHEVKHGCSLPGRGVMRAEAIQVAAMAVRFVQDVCDRSATSGAAEGTDDTEGNDGD